MLGVEGTMCFSDAGRAETAGVAFGFANRNGLNEGGLEAGARCASGAMRSPGLIVCGWEERLCRDDFNFAAEAGVDDASESVEAAQGHAGTVCEGARRILRASRVPGRWGWRRFGRVRGCGQRCSGGRRARSPKGPA